jgi:acetyl-CoA carboxylase / biotin carboxylase 1
MEAKGCAKPAKWKEARRYFYWATRARVARSALIEALSEASPDSSFEYRSNLLDSLAAIEPGMDNREIAAKLDKLDLDATLARLRADHLVRRMIELTQTDRKAAMDGLVRLADNFSEDERAAIVNAFQSASGSPNPPSYAT